MKSTPPPESPSDIGPSSDDLGARFAFLMMEHKDALYRYLLSMHPWVDEIDDLLQDTAITLWKKIDEYDTKRDFLPWALRFAYFEVLRWRKHMRKRRFVLSDELIEQLNTSVCEQEQLDEVRHAALQDCLKKLPKNHRQVVDQRYGKQGTMKELAQRLGTSVHKLYHGLEEARASLADCVQRGLDAKGYSMKGGSGK
ncbi:sigma-70 family RNA polymerase sigma factor [Verrucomicrobiaceae bacterium 227]